MDNSIFDTLTDFKTILSNMPYKYPATETQSSGHIDLKDELLDIFTTLCLCELESMIDIPLTTSYVGSGYGLLYMIAEIRSHINWGNTLPMFDDAEEFNDWFNDTFNH